MFTMADGATAGAGQIAMNPDVVGRGAVDRSMKRKRCPKDSPCAEKGKGGFCQAMMAANDARSTSASGESTGQRCLQARYRAHEHRSGTRTRPRSGR
jgi:hypothetical protein